MKKIGIVLLITMLAFTKNAQADLITFFEGTDTFMKKYVMEGRVSYVNVKKNFEEVGKLYNEIGTMDLSGADEATKKAFYLNAYNVIVIYHVSKYYPLKSPLDQSGFFDKVRHKVAGEMITLNELEIKKIILQYQDPRIHFALACAAVSCPQLASFAYQPKILDDQLNKRTIKAVNDPTFIRVDASGKTVNVSEIFKWYQKDFTRNGNTVMKFINTYKSTPVPGNFTLGYYQYDWNLNEQ